MVQPKITKLSTFVKFMQKKTVASFFPGYGVLLLICSYYYHSSANLVVDNKLGVLVEDGILSFSERSEVFEDGLWVDIGRRRVHDVISLFH